MGMRSLSALLSSKQPVTELSSPPPHFNRIPILRASSYLYYAQVRNFCYLGLRTGYGGCLISGPIRKSFLTIFRYSIATVSSPNPTWNLTVYIRIHRASIITEAHCWNIPSFFIGISNAAAYNGRLSSKIYLYWIIQKLSECKQLQDR